MIVTVDAELQRWSRAGVPPRSDHPKGRLIDSRQRLNATNDFLVKIDHLRRCLSVEDGGHVDGEDVSRIHPGLGPLQCEQCRHEHARAGEQNERSADLCDDEDTLPTFAAGDSRAAA